jgi:hypothetical protein
MCVIHKRHESVTDEYHSTMPTLPYISLSTSQPSGDKACPALHLGCVWHSSRSEKPTPLQVFPAKHTQLQDKEEKGPWSRPTLERRAVFGQLVASLTSSTLKGPPRQVSASHEKSPPRTTSLPSHDKPPPRTTSRGPKRTVYAPPPTRVEERFSTPCRYHSWRPCKQLTPTRALMLVRPAARPSHRHHLPLCHTQAQPKALKYPLRLAQA